MKLNSKIRYGVRTMIELAMNAGDSGMFQKNIAERQDIPLKYLDKIVSDLKSSGLIINVGGKRSGYILAKDARHITINDIYKAFEGRLSIIQCLNKNVNCCRNKKCASQDFWAYMNNEMEAIMSGKTLSDLVKTQIELDTKTAGVLDYQI
ncbi:MAG: Rrf2 family transcriptional regulator [Cyclobacteriaceae bacterium]|nr:Rrf2 family transcriptional regulator [Cyclobacteriaceae bacterium]